MVEMISENHIRKDISSPGFPDSRIHQAARILIGARSGVLNNFILKLDDVSGYEAQKPTTSYWKKNNFVHIKS